VDQTQVIVRGYAMSSWFARGRLLRRVPSARGRSARYAARERAPAGVVAWTADEELADAIYEAVNSALGV
jgi:hypothetical protein